MTDVVLMCSVCQVSEADIVVAAQWIGVSAKGERLLEKMAAASVEQSFCTACAGRVGFAMNDLQDEIREEAGEGAPTNDG